MPEVENPADSLNKFARENAGAEADKLAEAMGGQPAQTDAETPEAKVRRNLPTIELPRGGIMISVFADKLGRYAAAEQIFIKDGNVVTVDEQRGIIDIMPPEMFRTWVEAFCIPMKIRQKENGEAVELHTSMPRDVAGACLNSPFFRAHLRPLLKVNSVPLPTIRKDGKIALAKPGYDEETRVFTTITSGIEIADFTIDQSRAIIDDLLKEFPFAEQKEDGHSRSKAVQIAAMLSLFAADMFPVGVSRLGTMWIANSQRTGKSLLAKLAIAPVCGAPEVQSLPGNPEEIRKVLDVAAIAGSPYILFDDISKFVNSGDLNAFMTSPVYTGRLMNSQKKFRGDKVTTVFMTGNFLQTTPDIANRMLLCNLRIDTADYQGRKIKDIIDDYALSQPARRSRILSALWGLIRHWDATGRKNGESTMAGFEHYSKIIGGIVTAAGYGNPIAKPIDIDIGGDQRGRDFYLMMEEIFNRHRTAEKGASIDYKFPELVDICTENDLFTNVLTGKEYTDENGREHLQLTHGARSAFGKILRDYSGKTYEIPIGACLGFAMCGRAHSRTYPITWVRLEPAREPPTFEEVDI